MAKQVIGTGSSPNDGTGDTIRDAFVKVNANFDELYTDDAGDVNSITATAPIERDSATGAVTISLADNGVTLAKMAGIVRGKFIYGDASGNPAYLAAGANGKLLVADANGDPSWTTVSGDVTISAGAVTIADDAVDADKLANSINTAIAANTAKVTNATHTGDVTGATALTIANDAVTNAKLGVEYTATSPLSSAATIAVDTDTADIFTYTAGHSATLNFTDVVIGAMKSLVITGGGSSYTVALGTSNTASCTYNKISGTYDDTGSTKNLIQIKWVAVNEAWYTISQPA